MKFTQKQIKHFVETGAAIDITYYDNDGREKILETEKRLENIGYSSGSNGLNGLLLKGYNTNKLYAVCSRSTAIYIFA